MSSLVFHIDLRTPEMNVHQLILIGDLSSQALVLDVTDEQYNLLYKIHERERKAHMKKLLKKEALREEKQV